MRLRLYCSSAVAAVAACSSGAHAQSGAGAPPATTPSGIARQAPVPDQSKGTEATIVVTGSRIPRLGFESPTPVTVIGQDFIASKGVSNVADALAQVPTFRQSAGAAQASRLSLFTAGQSLLDLRGLGSVRTLVLVDSQRIVPSNTTGTFDVNEIPTVLIDRVDIVTGGASAAYGSDAVAGVVNFVLRRRMDGVEVGGHFGISEHGDNAERAIQFAAGTSLLNNRLHMLFGLDYLDNDGVGSFYERDWGRREPAIFGTGAGRPAGTPAQLLATNAELNNLTAGGIINFGPLRGTAFGPGGTPYQFQYGTLYGTWMTGSTANYGNSTFGHYNLKSPIERISMLGRIGFDLTDRIKLTLNGGYARTRIDGFGSYHQWPSIIVNADNPFIPAQTRADMLAHNLSTITVGRNSKDINDGFAAQGGNTTKWGSVQAEGQLGGDWKWSAYYGRGKTTYIQESSNLAIVPNFFAAIYAVPGPNGTVVCGPTASIPNLTPAQRGLVQPGCVPLNIFGEGSPSRAAIDYVTGDLINKYYLEQQSAEVNLHGSPFSTWAGPVSIAVGAEWRKDSVDSKIDPLALQGAWYAANAQPLVGENTVKEAYSEVVVPLLKDVPFAKGLELNGAVRRTVYHTSGAVTTWKAGVTYEVNDMLRLRATRSRDIRAPNLSELYSQGSDARAALINPFNGQSGAVTTTTTGNPNLTPEKADTITVGAAIRGGSGVVRGLQFSVDYYDIRVDDVISLLTAPQILSACRDVQKFCDAIVFDNSVFGISRVTAQPFNANQLHTTGLDLEFTYRVPFEAIGLPGQFDIRALTTWVRKLETTAANGVLDYAGYGQNGVPKWSYDVNLNYHLGNVTLNANVHGFSAIKYDVTLIGPDDPAYSPALPNSISDNTLPARTYLDLGVKVAIPNQWNKGLELFGNVDNVLDTDPPQFASVTLNSGGNPYDMIGRTFRLGAKVKF